MAIAAPDSLSESPEQNEKEITFPGELPAEPLQKRLETSKGKIRRLIGPELLESGEGSNHRQVDDRIHEQYEATVTPPVRRAMTEQYREPLVHVPTQTAMNEQGDAEQITKSVALGAGAGLLYPVGQTLMFAKDFASSMMGVGAEGFGMQTMQNAAAYAAPFVGIPLATGLLGRFIGKKFHRPGTGAAVGASLGIVGAHVLAGTAFSTLALPVGIGAAAGLGYFGIRRLTRGY